MGLWSRLFRSEQKGVSSLDLYREIYGGRKSASGVSVNWQTAIEVATVLACVRVIANGVSQVPFRVYQDDGSGRTLAKGNPLFKVLYRKPNPWQTSFSFRETMMYHAVLTGNAYAWKGMVGSNREIRALELIEPSRVRVTRGQNSGDLTYRVTADNGAVQTFGTDQIWHLRGPSWNGWHGMDSVKLARDAIGLSIATESAHAEFHKGSARVSGLLSVDDALGKEKFEFLSSWLDRHSEGGDRAGKPLVMDKAAKWTTFAMTGVDSQHLETRKHQIEEICRSLGVMPIMVGHADKTATYASAEQMFLAHVVHTLAPWYERIEQSADTQLLTEQELEQGYYTKFTPNGLMRGAAADRSAYYTAALGTTQQPGWMTRNEIRNLEEMDPVEGGDAFPELITATPPADTAPTGDGNGTD